MKLPLSNITVSGLAESAQRASAAEIALGSIAKQADKVEKGFRSREEWQKIWGCEYSLASQIIKKHLMSGKMVMKRFRKLDITSRYSSIPHYKST
jgi:hypothetical protein